MHRCGVASSPRGLTISELQQELERFAAESLSREFAKFADRIEALVETNLLQNNQQPRAHVGRSFSSLAESNAASNQQPRAHVGRSFSSLTESNAVSVADDSKSAFSGSRVPAMGGIDESCHSGVPSSLDADKSDLFGEVWPEHRPFALRRKNSGPSTGEPPDAKLPGRKRRSSLGKGLGEDAEESTNWHDRLRKGYWVGVCERSKQGAHRGSQFSETYSALSTRQNDVRKSRWRRRTLGFEMSDEAISWSSRDQLAASMEGSIFNSIVAALVLANLIFIGIETDTMARTWGTGGIIIFEVAEDLFCFIFVLEICLRLLVYRAGFFCMSDYAWNILDLLVVGCQLSDFIARFCVNLSLPSTTQFRILRLIRLFRMIRVFRAFRVLRYVKELRMLIASIVESFRPLFWTILLLSVISSMFGIMLTQLVTDYKTSTHGSSADQTERLELYYGTLTRSMLSLYQIISDGIHWNHLLHPLTPFCTPWIQICFVCYIACTVLAMMNVITGIFVDSVSRTAEQSRKRMLVYQMQQLFEEADTDHGGFINWEKFSFQLQNPQMRNYLKDIDLDEEDAMDLFKLLDVQDTRRISMEAWVSGCLTLTGPAKALDLATVLREVRLFFRLWQEHADSIEESMQWVTRTLAKRHN